jgi:N-acyl amino acid synthase of PEP-CTERM/exosortase system
MLMTDHTSRPLTSTTPHFEARVIDDVPALLEASYQLRYEVYCRERHFLVADSYPSGVEVDEFDPHSIHVGAIDESGQLAGTARIVRPNPLGFPLLRHCVVAPMHAHVVTLPGAVELSRLSVSRRYNRRRQDRKFGVEETPSERIAGDRRRRDGEIVLAITKALYQTSRRLGVTHWLVATEKSLQRVLARFGLPFHQIGAESDYYGMVAPYVLDLDELDGVIASGKYPALDDFTQVSHVEPPIADAGQHALLVPSTDERPGLVSR